MSIQNQHAFPLTLIPSIVKDKKNTFQISLRELDPNFKYDA